MSHTFGWVQNPGSLDTLKKVAGVFVKGSSSYAWLTEYNLPLLKINNFITDEDYGRFLEILDSEDIVMPYNVAKGKGAGSKSRKTAICTGIIQAAITAQKKITMRNLSGRKFQANKPYTDDWTAEGYLRWAIATGVIEYDSDNDSCRISDLGKTLTETEDNSAEEQEIYTTMLLSYPPVCRVLSILSDKEAHTKFEIGSRLGFKGELGFTSIPQSVYLYDYCNAQTATERSSVRSNLEGDADKYARMIAGWLVKLGWAASQRKHVTAKYMGRDNSAALQAWTITRAGEKAIIKSNGNSSNRRISKIVMYEMLASNKTADSGYVRFRRANILKSLKTAKTAVKIQAALKAVSLNETVETIKDDLENFENIGLRILKSNDKYKLLDNITALHIPARENNGKGNISELKERIRSRLLNVNHKYLVLIDLAYSNASERTQKNLDAKEFEIETAKLFAEEMGYRAERLGDANRPDVLLEYNSYGAIIDNKSYQNGLSISAALRDEMARYVDENTKRQPNIPPNEWWKWFSPDTKTYLFLYVTSFLRGNFANQLKYIYDLRKVRGAAISVENLLYATEAVKSGVLPKERFFELFNNTEIIYSATG